MISACTIIARNYLAHARVLATSFFSLHPDGAFTVLLIDDEAKQIDTSGERFECCRLSDIGLDRAEVGRLAGIYDVTELATAVKPPFLQFLLNRGATEVIYLDPDIRVYRSLDEVARLAGAHGIVLTPHMTTSIPDDGRRVNDQHILAAGVYNLGFIAVGARARGFLAWWWDKTRRQARIDPERMLFTDQRWMDFAPSFFDHYILKDPTYNVAYWNLHERDLVWSGDTYLVNGLPLTFFHFSGFDWKKPYLLSKHQAERPRILLSERPAVAKICQDYLGYLQASGVSAQPGLPYGWNTLPSGLPFDRHMRRIYRDGLDRSEAPNRTSRDVEPPNPFDPAGEAAFLEWLNEPIGGGLWPTISRYLMAVYDGRPDVQQAFPDLATQNQLYLDWVRSDGAAQEHIPQPLRPPPVARDDRNRQTALPADNPTPGINIVGYFHAELGVGEAGRLLTSTVEAAGIPHSTVVYKATPSRQSHDFAHRGNGRAPHDINILCVNADQTARLAREAGSGFFENRHTVGYWFWELDRFPSVMHRAFDYVDEVWTATRFVASGIRAIGRRPVYTIPLPVPIPRCSPGVTRSSLGLPDRFLFLFVFDFFSVLERKNPIGLIRAFAKAFRPDEGPVLVIKTINGAAQAADLERVRAAASGRSDILIVDEYYTSEQKNSLVGLCDCFISLHRSEGLGLTMAEAMGLGKPVIATGYSGNVDFMTPENSYLVDYTISAVPPGCDPYPAGSPWADPHLDHAVELMRRVYKSPEDAARKASRAREDIVTKHNPKAAAEILTKRIEEIRDERSQAAGSGARERARPAGMTVMSDSRPPEGSVAASLDYAASLLTPTAQAPDTPMRGPVLMLQNMLFRLLRPYWWQQRQVNQHLIEALRQVAQASERAAQSEPHQRASLEAVWKALHAQENATRADRERLTGLLAQATGLQERIRVVDAGQPSSPPAQEIQESISQFQASAANHLRALTDQLASTTGQVAELSQRLHAVPHMQDPARFCYTHDGRRTLGFRAQQPVPGDLYTGFEDIFRGDEAFIRERQRTYLPLLQGRENVIDLGSGRGEMLDVLREAGIRSSGVDVNEAMVTRCQERGHAVEHADLLTFLRNQADGSIPALFSSHVVEHLTYDDLIAFLRLSLAKLKPGGQLIFETPNPHALEAFKTFWTDLTHRHPIFPEVALAFCWLVGFDRAYVMFPNGTGDLKSDTASQGEYAVVATKSA